MTPEEVAQRLADLERLEAGRRSLPPVQPHESDYDADRPVMVSGAYEWRQLVRLRAWVRKHSRV